MNTDDKLDALRNRMKRFEDIAEDLKGAKDPDTLIHQTRMLGERVSDYTDRLRSVERKMDAYMSARVNIRLVTKDELQNVWRASELSLDQIAVHLKMEAKTDRPSVSKLMNGDVKDPIKRYLAYRFCMDHIIARDKD